MLATLYTMRVSDKSSSFGQRYRVLISSNSYICAQLKIFWLGLIKK